MDRESKRKELASVQQALNECQAELDAEWEALAFHNLGDIREWTTPYLRIVAAELAKEARELTGGSLATNRVLSIKMARIMTVLLERTAESQPKETQ